MNVVPAEVYAAMVRVKLAEVSAEGLSDAHVRAHDALDEAKIAEEAAYESARAARMEVADARRALSEAINAWAPTL